MGSPAALYRSLAALHRAGIPWPQALASASRGSPRWAGAVALLTRGAPPSEALDGLVPPLDVALLRAGERDGSMEQALEGLAHEHEEAARRRRDRLTASVYPLAVAHVAAVLLPLPDLMEGRTLPALLWALAPLVPAWTWILLRRRADRRARRGGGDDVGDPPPPRRLPGLRAFTEEADARGLDALGHLLDAGVPVREALPLAIRAGWGGRAALDLAEAARRVARGEDLRGAWTHLPPRVAGALASAEDAGELGSALRRAAGLLRADADARREVAARLLPILMTLVLGGIIAVRVIGFYARVLPSFGR